MHEGVVPLWGHNMTSVTEANVIDVSARRQAEFSPLRYPGGKSSLTDFFGKLIDLNFDVRPTYVEPYAGGAGAGLALLLTGRVAHLVLNDLDPAIWALWHGIVNEPALFRTLVLETPVTLDEWKRQKAIYAGGLDKADVTDLGFATFFLNRTNRSGVLNAGVIGGQQQQGTYRVDARFNKPTLLHRLDRIAAVRDRIEVLNGDGLAVIKARRRQKRTFVYADPPYYDKGSLLYLNAHTQAQHEALAASLRRATECRWVLTYDDVPEVARLYSGCRVNSYELNYSAHSTGAKRELMVFSENLVTEGPGLHT